MSHESRKITDREAVMRELVAVVQLFMGPDPNACWCDGDRVCVHCRARKSMRKAEAL